MHRRVRMRSEGATRGIRNRVGAETADACTSREVPWRPKLANLQATAKAGPTWLQSPCQSSPGHRTGPTVDRDNRPLEFGNAVASGATTVPLSLSIRCLQEGATLPVTADHLQWFNKKFRQITNNIETVIQGKRAAVELITICLVAEGHALIEDVPGVGKTQLGKSLARSIDCTFKRIQFTPDLLPSDVTGVSVWDRDAANFSFRPGPVFGNVVLGDEINRASPKTQAALLEAMEERQVTVDSVTRSLGPPFIVIATQNPIEHEGTYPLPEAQLDRFMIRLQVGYPERDMELKMLATHADHSTFDDLVPVVHAEDIVRMSDIARHVHVAEAVRSYIVDIADASRHDPEVLLGASPRASLFLQRAARAIAARDGRDYVAPDDVKRLLQPILNHRLILRPEAQMSGVTVNEVVARLAESVAVPGTRDPV